MYFFHCMGVAVKIFKVTGLDNRSVPPKSMKPVIRLRFSGLASSRPIGCWALWLYYLGFCDLASHYCAQLHECRRPLAFTVSYRMQDVPGYFRQVLLTPASASHHQTKNSVSFNTEGCRHYHDLRVPSGETEAQKEGEVPYPRS